MLLFIRAKRHSSWVSSRNVHPIIFAEPSNVAIFRDSRCYDIINVMYVYVYSVNVSHGAVNGVFVTIKLSR